MNRSLMHSVTVALEVTLALGLLSTLTFARDDPETPNLKSLDVWVLAGQSNSQGWALLKAPIPPNPRVFFFDADGHWTVAREPFNQNFYRWTPEPVDSNVLMQHHNLEIPHGESADSFLHNLRSESGNQLGGVGIGLMFAKRLQEATGRNIGVISTGVGSPIREWDPDSTPAGKLYTKMLERIRASNGKVKGLIWYQGESDALTPGSAAQYEKALLRFIDGVRRDLQQPDLPILCVQIGRFVYPYDSRAGDWELVREAQRQAVLERQHVDLVSAIDLLLEDDIHIGFEGYQRLSRRLAEVALSKVYGLSGHASPISFESAQLIASDSWRPMIRVKFHGVSGRLLAEGRPSGFSIRMSLPADDPAKNYPAHPAADVPLYSVYRVDFDPADPAALIIGLFDAAPIMLGRHHPFCEPINLIYAPGLNPYANITDERDMAIPAFGPVPIPVACDQAAR